MTPWLGGGKMITEVTFDGFKTQDVPYRSGGRYAEHRRGDWLERGAGVAGGNGHRSGGKLEPRAGDAG